MAADFQKFKHLSCILLSTIIGVLIAIPLCGGLSSTLRLPLLITSAGLGGLIGKRRKDSVAFFYFCLIAVVVLAWLVSFRYFVIDLPKND